MGLSDEQKAIKIHESGIELNKTFFKKLLTGRRHEKYADIASPSLPVSHSRIPAPGGAIACICCEFYGFCDTAVSS